LRLCYLFQIINGNFVFKLERACPVLNQIMMELQGGMMESIKLERTFC